MSIIFWFTGSILSSESESTRKSLWTIWLPVSSSRFYWIYCQFLSVTSIDDFIWLGMIFPLKWLLSARPETSRFAAIFDRVVLSAFSDCWLNRMLELAPMVCNDRAMAFGSFVSLWLWYGAKHFCVDEHVMYYLLLNLSLCVPTLMLLYSGARCSYPAYIFSFSSSSIIAGSLLFNDVI